MTTAIYARQSINKKDSISIETQIELCKKEVIDNSEIKVYQDKGFSGKNTLRPSFKQMISDVEQGLIKNIVVYRLDRISRSVVDFANIIDILNKHSVGFISANEKFDTSSPAGKAMLYIVMVFAQLERETIAERIKDNYYQRGTEGAWTGGPAPFGYNNTKVVINNKKIATLVENSDIQLVKYIFEEYAKEGISLGEIAKQLVAERQEMWNNIKLSRMLHNPAYVKADVDIYNYYTAKGCIVENDVTDFNGENGLNLYGKRDRALNKYNNIENHHLVVGLHKGVIPSSIFLKCQYKLKDNVQIKNSGKGKHTWLTGLVKCGNCGKAMVVRSYKNTKYFNCSGRAIHICDALPATLYVDKIEDILANQIKNYISNFKDCKIKTSNTENEIRINTIKIELAKIEKEINAIIDNLATANEIMIKYANNKIIELDNKRNQLLNKLNELNIKKENKLYLPDISNWDNMTIDLKKEIAKSLINKISLFHDKVEIEWKY